jgi:hypothetical protein
LPIKKTESVGDRVIRFLGLFLNHASEKGEYFADHLKIRHTDGNRWRGLQSNRR